MGSTVLKEINGQVVILTLNRPEKFNSFNREMSLQLQDELKKAANNSEIRAILITGTGKAFVQGKIYQKPLIPTVRALTQLFVSITIQLLP